MAQAEVELNVQLTSDQTDRDESASNHGSEDEIIVRELTCCNRVFGTEPFFGQVDLNIKHEEIVLKCHPETFRFIGYIMFWIMVLLCIAITKIWSNADLNKSNLLNVFGYLNICVWFDYMPTKAFAASFLALVELPFIIYSLSSYIRWILVYNSRTVAPNFSKCNLYGMIGVISLKLFFIIQFRLVFVYGVELEMFGHLIGFLGLQIAIAIMGLENYLYMWYLGVTPQLSKNNVVNWTLSGIYVSVLGVVTIVKFFYCLFAVAGKIMWDIHHPTGIAFAKTLDYLWMLFAAIIPILLALYGRQNTPGYTLNVPLGTIDTFVKRKSGHERVPSEKEYNAGRDKPAFRTAQVSGDVRRV